MNKIILVTIVLTMLASIVYADEQVGGYTRRDGTYVQPHTRSTPDSSYNNNYNVRGNTNPNNGERGTSSPTYNDRTPEYNQRNYGNSGTINNSNSGTHQRKSYYGY